MGADAIVVVVMVAVVALRTWMVWRGWQYGRDGHRHEWTIGGLAVGGRIGYRE